MGGNSYTLESSTYQKMGSSSSSSSSSSSNNNNNNNSNSVIRPNMSSEMFGGNQLSKNAS